MTKNKKVVGSSKVLPYVPKYRGLTFKVQETVLTSQSVSVPLNLAEEKAKFIRTGVAPQFEVKDPTKLSEIANKMKNQIRFDLLASAEYILEHVRDKYGDGERYLEHAYGPRITAEEATPMLLEYIEENSLTQSLKIHWCDNLACSAKMVWKGPLVNANRPERRKYSLWINASDENNYMRESGIRCLMDHEIGTHFFRMFNDGFQPWFSHRSKFGLRNMGSFESQCTEEGLASINTALRGRAKFLWGAAFTYYTACKSAELNFKQLFDHIGRYTSNIDYRWKQVMRIKRGLANPNDLGGLANDQCYFEGAVAILRNVDKIDFNLLMSGKVCVDELDRIKRVVRKDFIRLPTFMHNMTAYRNTLKQMALLNGLDKEFPKHGPPIVYITFLNNKNNQVKEKPKKVSFLSEITSKCNATEMFENQVSEITQLLTSSESDMCSKLNTIEDIELHTKIHMKEVQEKFQFSLTYGQMKKKKEAKSSKQTVPILKKKKLGEGDNEELVKSFSVSDCFIDMHSFQAKEEKRLEESLKAVQLVEKMCSEIITLDQNLNERIKKLQDIVEGHEWSNNDSKYKEELMKSVIGQVESSVNQTEQILGGTKQPSKQALCKIGNSSNELKRNPTVCDAGGDEKKNENSLSGKFKNISNQPLPPLVKREKLRKKLPFAKLMSEEINHDNAVDEKLSNCNEKPENTVINKARNKKKDIFEGTLNKSANIDHEDSILKIKDNLSFPQTCSHLELAGKRKMSEFVPHMINSNFSNSRSCLDTSSISKSIKLIVQTEQCIQKLDFKI